MWVLLVAAGGDDYDVVEGLKWIQNLLLKFDVYSSFD